MAFPGIVSERQHTARSIRDLEQRLAKVLGQRKQRNGGHHDAGSLEGLMTAYLTPIAPPVHYPTLTSLCLRPY
jgi:hypothetical protein